MPNDLTRRAALAGAGALVPALAFGQDTKAQLGVPPSVITRPPRTWGRRAPPNTYPDPDILVIDKSFNQYLVGLTAIHRLWTGFQWAEGPAWSGEGRYVVFSDVKGNTQYRYIWESGRVTPYRKPSYNSNGNSFDFQGRQLSTQDFFRRVVRWEPDGAMTVIAELYDGKPLNSPNDLVPHPDGSIWFTDPPYGALLSEGHPDANGGRANPDGLYDPNVGDLGVGLIGGVKQELPTNTYRWDPNGQLTVVVSGDDVPNPNGLCFSADYKTLYVIRTRSGARPDRRRQGGGVCVRRAEPETLEPAAVHRLHGRWRALRPRRHARRSRRQSVDQLQRAVGLFRRDGVEPRRQADRADPPAGSLRQSLFRRAEAGFPVHVREPVDLHGAREHPGRRARLSGERTRGASAGIRAVPAQPGAGPQEARSTISASHSDGSGGSRPSIRATRCRAARRPTASLRTRTVVIGIGSSAMISISS